MYFPFFSDFFGLKPKLSKCEIIIGILKGVQVAACGIRSVNLKNDTWEILDTHFSYNEKLKEDKNLYTTVTNVQLVLKILKLRNLTVERKIVIFKTEISKIVFQSFITNVPRHIVNELEKIQKAFFRKNSSPKIKHETLCNNYKGGG